jgi:hypothetical protein
LASLEKYKGLRASVSVTKKEASRGKKEFELSNRTQVYNNGIFFLEQGEATAVPKRGPKSKQDEQTTRDFFFRACLTT